MSGRLLHQSAQKWRRAITSRASFTLVGLLALLSCMLAGCGALPLPFGATPAQQCVTQQVGSLGAGGGVIVPLAANDPTASDHTSGLYAVRASDGALAWSCATTTWAGWDDAQMVNGTLYALAGTAPTKDAPAPMHAHAIYAIRPQDGEQLWSYSFQAGSTSQLAFDDGLIFVASVTADASSSHSDLYAIHVATGALAWQASFSETLGQPVIVGNRIVVSVTAGARVELRALRESDGATLWTHSLPDHTQLDSWLSQNGALYFTDGSSLTALDGANGAVRWQQQGFTNLSGRLFSAHGDILFATGVSVLAFDMFTGSMRWSAVLGGQARLMAVTNTTAYAFTQGADGFNDHLFALSLSTGDALWQRSTPVAGTVAPAANASVYVTTSTGARLLANVIALDAHGARRWMYSGSSPYPDGALIPSGGAVYYVWQADPAHDAHTTTYVTSLRASNGATLWTRALPAYNTTALAPLLAP